MIVKAEDMHDKMREIIQKIPWKSKFFIKPLRKGQLFIKITVKMPSELGMMFSLTDRIDRETLEMQRFVNQLIFEEMRFYSDTYSQFTVYNYMISSGKVIYRHEARIHDRLRSDANL